MISDAVHLAREWGVTGRKEMAGRPTAYLGPFPIPTHRTVAQVDRDADDYGDDPEPSDRAFAASMKIGSTRLRDRILAARAA